MKDSKVYLFTALALIVWIVLAWFIGSWLGLAGLQLWLLRGGLWLLGLLGAIGFLWLHRREKRKNQQITEASAVDLAFREAAKRLQSPTLGADAKLPEMSCLLIAGEPGAAKTSIAVHSGLEPELLSGQVFRDRDIVPTRTVNLWYARKNVLVELGGALLDDEASRARLIKRLTPSRLGSIFGGKRQPARAALLCVNAESFIQAGGAEATAVKARQLNTFLSDLSQRLGIRLPVYVLFTKMDRVPHFQEFVAHLTNEEAGQVFGATLPMLDTSYAGTYSESETNRLSIEFETLYRSLCDRRPDLLGREHDAGKLPPTYEFPREFRKLRSLMVAFLVDSCRPSQLQTSPFLRGFYFTGVRPYVVRDVVVEQQVPVAQRPSGDMGATQVFSTMGMGGQAPTPLAPRESGGGRRVAQWVFLHHLFSGVVLVDQAAKRSSGASTRVGFGRRLIWATAAVLAIVFMIGWTVSWRNNRSLGNQVIAAAENVPALNANQDGIPELDQLQRLDRLRELTENLSTWRREGAPWRYRWGLYSGNSLYPGARAAYFETFRRMLLRTTQDALTRFISRPQSGQSENYRPVYNALKGYLMTTSDPERTTEAFLVPVLMEYWQRGRAVDDERIGLVENQFSFYATELPFGNPFEDDPQDAQAVAAARAYLSGFGASEAAYAAMLSAASGASADYVFTEQYPNAAGLVTNNYRVPGAFTRDGFEFMAGALANPGEYFAGEEWVLGTQAAGTSAAGEADLAGQLAARYQNEFIQHWRTFLQSTTVVNFKNVEDASAKMGILAGNRSPLLGAICAVAHNTAVAAQDAEEGGQGGDGAAADLGEAITRAFQPPQQVEPANCDEVSVAGGPNDDYVKKLLDLGAALGTLAGNANNQAAFNDANAKAGIALSAAGALASGFLPDREGSVDAKTKGLLEDPIRYAQGHVGGIPVQQANSGVPGFCQQYTSLMRKYPFNPTANPETNAARLDEFEAVFRRPDGALWQLYDGGLNQYMVPQGGGYARRLGAEQEITPQFLSFFNRAASVSNAFYRDGSGQARLSFTIGPAPLTGYQGVTLTMDGDQASFQNNSGASTQFTWVAAGAHQASLEVEGVGGRQSLYTSAQLWAPFQVFYQADAARPGNNGYVFDWIARTGTPPTISRTPDGQAVTARVTLTMNPPVFDKNFWSGAQSCPATAVR